MRTLSIIAAGLAAIAAVAAAPAPAASGLCYDVEAVVNGDQVVAEADCVELP